MSSRSRRKHERLSPPDITGAVDRYEPDYAQSCENCGECPTVTGLHDGAVVIDSGLCGPCFWKDSRGSDPSTWNG
jgi:hypothetical protein